MDESNTTPFVELDRRDWSRLSASTPLPLTADDVARLRGMSDPIDLAEVDTVYRPLSRLLGLYVAGVGGVHAATSTFLGERATRTPFVIGVAGSVAVGKSTAARVLVEMLRRWPETPHVELVTTDGFLLPNAELERRGLMQRKGFPESYDRRALLRFLTRVKSGAPEVDAPVYDHLRYDVVPDRTVTVRRPDVLVVEGLNVLQPARPGRDGAASLAVSDFFDFSIYVDARARDIERWYVDRFLRLRRTAFAQPGSYFRRYADLDDAEATATARDIWRRINEPNLRANIVPTRSRASLVMTKDAEHRIQRVLLRKL
ncbi:type I pantothenate kinase [Serinibacter arcticus]|uniref:Pantothenate kinase n=1 Tax=Serinibacter arcticus TaxID=1655435 RepID=A0A2U1ZZN6_9MICO|nr:type I pantothenate kinase [Serinibacter arcticus]PWD52431.1 type I pantothenate kinase [Serinibacter arcticus]